MRQERIDEPLSKVYALFEKGRVRPIAMEWSGRHFDVVRINSNWIDRSANRPSLTRLFSLTMQNGDIFQVSYTEEPLRWRLDSIVID